MQNRKTEKRKAHARFMKRSAAICKIFIAWAVLLVIGFSVSWQFADQHLAPLLISIVFILTYPVLWIVLIRIQNRQHAALFGSSYGESDDETLREGLFKDLWEEYEWNQFEGCFAGKTVVSETFNNTIDLEIVCHKHEYCICIDSETLCMIRDEETDMPIEKEIPLSAFHDVGEVIKAIRCFIEGESESY